MDVCRDSKNRIAGAGKDPFLKIQKFKLDTQFYFYDYYQIKRYYHKRIRITWMGSCLHHKQSSRYIRQGGLALTLKHSGANGALWEGFGFLLILKIKVHM